MSALALMTQRRLLTAWEMASSLLAGRRSEDDCSNGNDIGLTFLDELRRVSVLMAVTRACCKEATLSSERRSVEAAPACVAAWWNWGSEIGRRATMGRESSPSWSFRAARSS